VKILKNLSPIAAVLTLLSCGGGGSSPATVVPPPAATVAPTSTPTQISTATPTPAPTVTDTPTTTPTAQATPAAPFAPVEISRVGQWGSVYDNWVIKSGGKYIQFRCQNTASPVERDRIWRSESLDGVSNWTNDRIAIEGTSETAQDDLSCSPGVAIDPNGLWHMYYVTAARATGCTIEMWHATSLDGLTWTKLGKLPAVPVSDCSLIEPSPIVEGNGIAVYFVANWTASPRASLWKMTTSDGFGGQAFSPPRQLTTPSNFYGGRVTKANGTYYLAYSGTLDETIKIPDVVYLTSGSTGFSDGYRVAQATPGTFYATQLMAGNYLDGRLYVAGNYMPLCATVAASAVCSDYPNAVGLLQNVPMLAPTPNPTATPTATPTSTPWPTPGSVAATPTPCVSQPGPGGGGCAPPTPAEPIATPTHAAIASPTPSGSSPTPCIPQPGPGGGGCPQPVGTPTPWPTPAASQTPTAPPAVGTQTPTPSMGNTTTGCTLMSSPTQFTPYPSGAPQPASITISGIYPYAGTKLLVAEPFGYQVLDVTNRNNPQSLGFEDYRISPTYPGPIPCGGDCHGTIGAASVSADGQRVIFGVSSLAAGSSPLQTRVGQSNGVGFTLAGDMVPSSPSDALVQRIGSSYYAYTFASDGVRVANATTLPGLDPNAPNNLQPSLAPSLPGGYNVALAGYWITYWDGSNIYLVNASSPFPASALTAQRFTKTDFGHIADRLTFFSAAQDPTNPAAVYLLGEFAAGASGTKHAGWALVRVQGGVSNLAWSLLPSTSGESLTYVIKLAADNAGNLFAFMWSRTSTGTPRLYTSSVLTFGAASPPIDVTASGFSLGRPAYVAGAAVGQIYAYSPSGSTGWIVPLVCK
jgi:hypothetical protein